MINVWATIIYEEKNANDFVSNGKHSSYYVLSS